MNRGSIKIEENNNNEFIVKVSLEDGNVWLTQYEIARLFNVYENTIRNNLRAIFKAGILYEEDVSYTYSYQRKGKQYSGVLYDLQAIIAVSYRIASFEARAFRKWVKTAIKDNLERKVNIIFDLSQTWSDFSKN